MKKRKKYRCLACRKRLRFWQKKKFNMHGQPYIHYKHTLGYGWYKDAKKGILQNSEQYLKEHKRGTRRYHG